MKNSNEMSGPIIQGNSLEDLYKQTMDNLDRQYYDLPTDLIDIPVSEEGRSEISFYDAMAKYELRGMGSGSAEQVAAKIMGRPAPYHR